MDAMLATLPPDASPNCSFLQGIFLERMSDYICSHLSLPKFESSRDMAVMADTLWAGHVKGGPRKVRSLGGDARPCLQIS
jgi:hypothetical protein